MFSHIWRRSFTLSSTLPPTIKQILENSGKIVHKNGPNSVTTVCGWIKSFRRQKKVSFAVVNDGTTLQGLQAVFLHPTVEQQLPLKGIVTGASVRLTGRLIESPGAGQANELQVENVEILGDCDPEKYPIQKKDHSLEFLREQTHLRARTSDIAAMLRVRDKLVRGFSHWYENEGFIYAHPPIMTSNDCEGTGEAYNIISESGSEELSTNTSRSSSSQLQTSIPEPESSRIFLTTSTQLHLETLTASLARVYTIAPSFRAERSQTNRHLNEFWMLEAEMSFLPTGLDAVCDVVETSLKSVLGQLVEDEDVKYLRREDGNDTMKTWLEPANPWQRITYSDALDALEAHHKSGAQPNFIFDPPKWGEALRSEHERWIAHQSGGPVFVTDYPRDLKPFYMWVNDVQKTGPTVACFDLLVPKLGELTGGSVRESRLEKLKESLVYHDMGELDHSWYVDLRRYGTTPHGGFGIGFERLMSWFCGIENIRECIAFPRWGGRIVL